ncbi:hypothetical protein XHC_1369 [Xanthomonas hortorum pv. carotae str. M081]|nr:hypothetical protein XHC_1369 [Xanthomonas hortorum pv. carotae str. M081]
MLKFPVARNPTVRQLGRFPIPDSRFPIPGAKRQRRAS